MGRYNSIKMSFFLSHPLWANLQLSLEGKCSFDFSLSLELWMCHKPRLSTCDIFLYICLQSIHVN